MILRRIYDWLILYFREIFAVALILFVLDIFFYFLIIPHAILLVFINVILIVGETKGWSDEETEWQEPCKYCTPIENLPEPNGENGFAVWDGYICFDSGEWNKTEIYHCPMCGRLLVWEDFYE